MVLVEQIYTSCLSQASYYIESNGEAAVIDPSRETNHFIEKAKKSNSEIKFIFQIVIELVLVIKNWEKI